MGKGFLEQGSHLHTLMNIAQNTNPINTDGTAGHIQEEGEDSKNHLIVKEVVKTSKQMVLKRELNEKLDKNMVNMQCQTTLKLETLK